MNIEWPINQLSIITNKNKINRLPKDFRRKAFYFSYLFFQNTYVWLSLYFSYQLLLFHLNILFQWLLYSLFEIRANFIDFLIYLYIFFHIWLMNIAQQSSHQMFLLFDEVDATAHFSIPIRQNNIWVVCYKKLQY